MQMEEGFSLYLDLVRFLASVLVVVSHLTNDGMVSSAASAFLPDLGRESVIIFFVLSGYVIAYTTNRKGANLQGYLVARSARIFSVAAPILVLAAVLYLATTWLGYRDSTYQARRFYLYYPFYLTFLGDSWNLAERPPWLHSYWSLNFEVWYYALFAFLFFYQKQKKWIWVGLLLLLLGFKHWMLFPIWLSGVLLLHFHDKYKIGKVSARIGWLFTLFALIAYKCLDLDQTLKATGVRLWPFPNLSLSSAEKFMSDYVVCVLVFFNFFFARFSSFSFLGRYSRWIKGFASYTFTLYLLHPLINSLWNQYANPNPGSWLNAFALLSVTGLLTFVVGMVTEHKKDFFTRFFRRFYTVLGDFLGGFALVRFLLFPNKPSAKGEPI